MIFTSTNIITLSFLSFVIIKLPKSNEGGFIISKKGPFFFYKSKTSSLFEMRNDILVYLELLGDFFFFLSSVLLMINQNRINQSINQHLVSFLLRSFFPVLETNNNRSFQTRFKILENLFNEWPFLSSLTK